MSARRTDECLGPRCLNLHHRLVAHQGRRSHRGLGHRKLHQGIDGGPGDSERHRCQRNDKQADRWYPVEHPGLQRTRRKGRHRERFGDKNVLETEIMAARAPQTADLPGVDHIHGRSRQEQEAHLRRSGGGSTGNAVLVDDTVGYNPSGMVDAAGISPSPGSAEPPGSGIGATRRVDRAGNHAVIVEDGPRHCLGQASRQQAEHRRVCSTPAHRPVGHRQSFDDRDAVGRMQLGAAQLARQPKLEQPGSAQLFGKCVRQSPRLFDLLPCHGDVGRQLVCHVQKRLGRIRPRHRSTPASPSAGEWFPPGRRQTF